MTHEQVVNRRSILIFKQEFRFQLPFQQQLNVTAEQLKQWQRTMPDGAFPPSLFPKTAPLNDISTQPVIATYLCHSCFCLSLDSMFFKRVLRWVFFLNSNCTNLLCGRRAVDWVASITKWVCPITFTTTISSSGHLPTPAVLLYS